MKTQKQVFAENLQRLINSRRIDQRDLAIHLGVSDTSISNWLKASKYPRIDKIQMLADYFNVAKSELIEEFPTNMKPMNPATLKIPILGKIACGDPINAEENFIGYRYKSPDGLPKGNLYVLEAVGRSMEPTVPHGAEVIIREQPDVESGEIAAVLVNGDEEATLKRIKRQGEVMMLMPDNPAFNPIVVSEDYPVKIIGKAVEITLKL